MARPFGRGWGVVVALALAAPGCGALLWTLGLFRVVRPVEGGVLFGVSLVGGLLTVGLAFAVRGVWRLGSLLCGGVAVSLGLAFAATLAGPPDERAALVRAGPETAVAGERIRVLQLNVLHGYPRREELEERVVALERSLEAIDPDLVLLQEAWRMQGHGDLVARLAERLDLWAYYARANGSLRLLGFEEGPAVLSRFPLGSARRLELSPRKHPLERRVALEVEVALRSAKLETVVSAHLSHSAPVVARGQAEDLVRQLEGTTPLVVSGDFNQPAGSPTLTVLGEAGLEPIVSEGVDHVLAGPASSAWKVLWTESTLGASDVERLTGSAREISDHPGLVVELRDLGPPTGPAEVPTLAPRAPGELGFDEARLLEAVEALGAEDGVRALLVLRHGEVAVERYFGGAGPARLRNLKSASKSVLSALAGIAVAEGFLALDQRVVDVLPGIVAVDGDPRSEITIEHLLSMTSGLESTSFGNYGAWATSSNWVRHALGRPLEERPGERYRYSTGNTHILSAALTAATGRSSLDWAREYLFSPLGIERVEWERDRQGIYTGGNNLALTPRAMARFGQLYLDRGRWGSEQVVPWSWVDTSTDSHALSSWSRRGYGYLWWLRPEDERNAFMASGFGGQYIYISPAWDLVVVISSTEVSKGREWRRAVFSAIREGILGSLPAYPSNRPRGSHRYGGHVPSTGGEGDG